MDVRFRTGRLRRGAAAVELAVVLPLLMIMLLGLWETGRLINVRQVLSNAAREGGRQASTGLHTESEVAQIVRDYLKHAGIPTGNVGVAVKNLSSEMAGTKGSSQFDPIEVVVTIPIEDIRVIDASVMMGSSSVVIGRATWYSMKNKPYPSPPNPPIE